VIEGIKTNIDFFKRLTINPEYVAGKMDTHLVERM
jgi:biotin carboxylase